MTRKKCLYDRSFLRKQIELDLDPIKKIKFSQCLLLDTRDLELNRNPLSDFVGDTWRRRATICLYAFNVFTSLEECVILNAIKITSSGRNLPRLVNQTFHCFVHKTCFLNNIHPSTGDPEEEDI